MTSLIQTVGERIIGTVEEVSADRISVLLDPAAPQATALNTGVPAGFPRINGYVLIPNEAGATACIISSVRIERLPYPKHGRMRRDLELVDLPIPSRVMNLTPIGTLRFRSAGGKLSFRVQRGVDVFPSVGDPVVLPDVRQLTALVEGEDNRDKRIHIGQCPTAARAPVYLDPDKLFGRHFAVLGNTGAGKSCSVAGLVRWSLDAAKNARMEAKRSCKPNARFIVLDPNGEYGRAFQDFDVRLFRVDPGEDAKALQVPAWLWNGPEWAAFTGAAPGAQRPVLFEALRHLRTGLGVPGKFGTDVKGRIKRYRSRLKVLVQGGDHMTPGKKEGVAKFLLNIGRDFDDLVQRPECTEADRKKTLQSVASRARKVERGARGNPNNDGYWHNDFAEAEIDGIREALQEAANVVGLDEDVAPTDESAPVPFSVKELPEYVEALAADHTGRDIAQFVDTLGLRIRSLLGGDRLASVIQPTGSVTLADWLTDYIGGNHAENGTITVVDLSLVPVEVIHVVVSVIARVVFEALQRYRRENGHELPTALVLEEAHTFVHRDLTGESAPPAGRECARVFERIAREGRKFGLGLVLASQRPSEVSPTVLSQCNTFLLHRLVNDRDQELVRRLVPDGLGPLLRELPSLPTRRAILLGWAAPAPVLVEILEIPDEYRPHSPDPAFWNVWIGDEERAIDWPAIARAWQGVGSTETPE